MENGQLSVQRFDTISQLIKRHPSFDAFLIDMPIGLQETGEEKRPDADARKMLKGRASSIFPVPARQPVYARGESLQKQANLKVLGKSLSKQSMFIIPKIRELDEFLESHPKYKNVICECHPELSFALLNGEALQTRKYGIEGFEEREKILSKYLPPEMLTGLWERAKELKCKPDDVMDAVCLAVVAALKAQGKSATVPPHPETDARGLRMQIIIPI